MKKTLSLIKVSSALCLGLASLGFAPGSRAQSAPPFSGTISFDGAAMLDAPIGSATHITDIFGISGPSSEPQVIYGPTGNYSVIPAGTPVTFAPFIFGPTESSASIDFTLWSFSLGSTNYSFEVRSETHLSQSCMFLNIAGTGTAYIDGFGYTNATWEITETGSGPNLTFGASTTVTPVGELPVPEPSAFALLAGFAPVYCLFRRRNPIGAPRQKYLP